jgi:hypothetical protein
LVLPFTTTKTTTTHTLNRFKHSHQHLNSRGSTELVAQTDGPPPDQGKRELIFDSIQKIIGAGFGRNQDSKGEQNAPFVCAVRRSTACSFNLVNIRTPRTPSHAVYVLTHAQQSRPARLVARTSTRGAPATTANSVANSSGA